MYFEAMELSFAITVDSVDLAPYPELEAGVQAGQLHKTLRALPPPLTLNLRVGRLMMNAWDWS